MARRPRARISQTHDRSASAALHRAASATPFYADRSGRRRPPSRYRGFTLIEAALATIIVGVGVLSIMAAQQAFHKQNAWSTHASTATWLGNEIREMTLTLPRHDPITGEAFWGPEPGEFSVEDYNDVDDFDGPEGTGTIFSATLGNGPINARREVISDMNGWSQTIHVVNVDPADITTPVDYFQSRMLMVEVIVEYQGPNDPEPTEVTRVSWITPN